MLIKLRYALRVLLEALKGFIGDNCFRYSAALSFYTLFSIAPMVMISIHIASLVTTEVDFQEELVQQFGELVGEQGAQGITVLISSVEEEQSSRLRLIVSSLVLLFSATNIFVQLQVAFNVIFSVGVTGRGVLKQVLDRLISLGIIISLGLIMIVSLVIDSGIVLLHNALLARYPDLAVVFVSVVQYLALVGLAAGVIYALLHFLPDVHLPRRYKISGCVLITLLLLLGKSSISWYIATSQFSEMGGASASVIVLMLWVYYSSLIVFFGAEVIKGMATVDGITLHPRRYAVRVRSVVVTDTKADEIEQQQGSEPAPDKLLPS